MADKGISTVTNAVTLRDKWGRVVRRETYIKSSTLRATLHTIKDKSKEEHTRNNLQTLIDQIDDLDPSL